MTSRRRALALAVAAALLAAAGALPAAEGAGSAPPPAIEFVMPPPDAFIASGPVIVAGRLPAGTGALELLLDGAPVAAVTRDGDSFSAVLTPRPGQHALAAAAGGLAATLAFTSGTGGRGTPPYRYHTPLLEGRCAECHAGLKRQSPRAEIETCTTCHRALAVVFPYVHGPVAAGKCLVCHDPHGSARQALANADPKTLCVRCHDQPTSLAHIETARSRVCHLCHNPHASMNRRLVYDIVK